jgi:hypothetical protein
MSRKHKRHRPPLLTALEPSLGELAAITERTLSGPLGPEDHAKLKAAIDTARVPESGVASPEYLDQAVARHVVWCGD